MLIPFRWAFVAALCLATACAQTSQPAVHAQKPPADFVYIGSGDTSEDKKINVNINTDLMDSNDPDHKLTIFFGLLFAGAIKDPKDTSGSTAGTGHSYSDPLVFSAVADQAELDAIANYLATHFPGHDDVIGHLYRSPEKRYLVWAVFETRAGSNALYFDVTKWATVNRSAFGG